LADDVNELAEDERTLQIDHRRNLTSLLNQILQDPCLDIEKLEASSRWMEGIE
jgi:hypothetical protein